MKGNAKHVFQSYKGNKVSISVQNTLFFSGSGWYSGGLEIAIPSNICSNISIQNCHFTENIGKKGSHMSITICSTKESVIKVSHSTFSKANGPPTVAAYGVALLATTHENVVEVTMEKNIFINNRQKGLQILQVNNISIIKCLFSNNVGTGLFIKRNSVSWNNLITITDCDFLENSRALHLLLTVEKEKFSQATRILNCKFKKQVINSMFPPTSIRAIVLIESTNEQANSQSGNRHNRVLIENVIFEDNYEANGDCASLHIANLNATLKNLNFNNNNCTGIYAIASTLTVNSYLNMTSNYGLHGGAHTLGEQAISCEI